MAEIKYLTTDDLRQQIENRLNQLRTVLAGKNIEQIQTLKGSIRILKTSGKTQFYLITKKGDTNGKYISKKKISFVKAICQNNYDKQLVKELQKEISSLTACLKSYNPQKMQKLYLKQSLEKQKMITPVLLEQSDFSEKWQKKAYERKGFEEEEVEFNTSSGLRVRSKSELLIAEILVKMKIPFRYEFPVKLKEYTVHPDFFCLNVKNGEEIIWEHFGLVENPDYAAAMVKKIQAYQEKGYFPGKNLIYTFESLRNPLNTKQIEEIIKVYFG